MSIKQGYTAKQLFLFPERIIQYGKSLESIANSLVLMAKYKIKQFKSNECKISPATKKGRPNWW